MDALPSPDTHADPADVSRRIQEANARDARYWRVREEMAVYAADVRAGRFANPNPPPSPAPLPWDGVKNSQLRGIFPQS